MNSSRVISPRAYRLGQEPVQCVNRYLALFIFMCRFIGMDDQEKLMVLLSKAKETLASFTKVMVKSMNLLVI